MRIWCIKIGTVYAFYYDPWVEASTGGLIIPEGLYSPVAMYYVTNLKYGYVLRAILCNHLKKFGTHSHRFSWNLHEWDIYITCLQKCAQKLNAGHGCYGNRWNIIKFGYFPEMSSFWTKTQNNKLLIVL